MPVPSVIKSKAQMYELLGQGAFGNTIPQWLSISDWEETAPNAELWGVRTLTAGGPCRLFCPKAEVPSTFQEFERQGHKVQISTMIDQFARVTLMAEVYDSDTGLTVYGVDCPEEGANWRKVMPSLGRTYTGVEARRLLARRMNPSSLADLWALLELFPGHVVEFSTMDRCFGTVPGRDCVIWEVRSSDGTYENW